MAKIVSITGLSGSGKTTAVEALIRHFVARGRAVGAIKHTHHAVNLEDRGDTRRFREAGADPVILAGGGAAIIFQGSQTRAVEYAEPVELISYFSTDLVLVEGFRDAPLPAVIELRRGEWKSLDELLEWV